MSELKLGNKNDYAKSVCLFLAEGMRTRKLTLRRALEIAQKVLDHMNLLDTERDFLKLIKELSIDFQELVRLENRISMHIKSDERTKMEILVKDYVAQVLAKDMTQAIKIMEHAIEGHANLEQLKQQFPEFKVYLENNAKQSHIKR